MSRAGLVVRLRVLRVCDRERRNPTGQKILHIHELVHANVTLKHGSEILFSRQDHNIFYNFQSDKKDKATESMFNHLMI